MKEPTASQTAARKYKLMKIYGITLTEYEEIKCKQNGKCAICQRAKGLSRNLQVDHNHSIEVGKDETLRRTVRGLLCGRCNNRLGWYEANRDKISVYLGTPPAVDILQRA